MDFTKKLKSFVARQESKQPPQIFSPPESISIPSPESTYKKEKEAQEAPCNPEIEQQILDSIEPVYFSDEKFDASDFELKKLSEIVDLKQINADRSRLKKQQQVVSKKVSELIIQHQGAYMRELDRVADLNAALDEAINICQQGRRYLSTIQTEFTVASLGILSNYRKREKLKGLLCSLHTIKTLQETDVRMRELLDEEDYFGAIQLCLECQKAASTFRHFNCISELHSKLQDTLEMTEEQLDVALSKVCFNFDPTNYKKLQAAYHLLGKTQTAADQLVMHFSGAIHNRAFTIVMGYVELYSPTGPSPASSTHKRFYADLCKQMIPEGFLPCLRDLCKALWVVMLNYAQVLEWHRSSDESNYSPQSDQQNYVLHKLSAGRARVWQDVQTKIRAFLAGSDLAAFKFDHFIQVLDIVARLVDIGEEFCDSRSEDLQEAIRKQTVNYFKNYHRSCMDELRMFLENESWDLCPVKRTFSIFQLQEFQFIKHQRPIPRSSPNSSPSSVPDNDLASKQCHRNLYFHISLKDSKITEDPPNPFDIPLAEEEENREESLFVDQEEEEANISESDESDVPEELTKEYYDKLGHSTHINKHNKQHKEDTSSSNSGLEAAIVTNTTLNILRLFGKYMRMMSVLRTIAFDVLICMSHLYDYYMYAVYLFFAREMGDMNENVLSNKLRTALKRTEDNLILLDETDLEDPKIKDKVPPPQLSPVVSLDNIETLFGLAARVAATESLVFLTQQFGILQPHLEADIPASKWTFLNQFVTQTGSTCVELRKPVYMTVSTKAVDYEQVVALMAGVRFDVHDIPSQHSPYVDVLLRELQVLSMRIEEVARVVPIPSAVLALIWEHCIRLSNRTFVEGFSLAKKCTPEGRALMQLDYQQFLSKLEPIAAGSGCVLPRPLPDRELVESYVKAFYLLEPALEQFIRTHREYSPRQLTNLVLSVSQVNKKGRQRLLALVEEIHRR